MAMVIVCDCTCHEYDTVIPNNDYATFADKDICGGCLMQCRRWQPYVDEPRLLSVMEKAFEAIYAPLIEEQLRSQVQFLNRFGK